MWQVLDRSTKGQGFGFIHGLLFISKCLDLSNNYSDYCR